MTRIRVGAQLHPQHTTYAAYAAAIQQVDALGVDTIWNWDHFFPLYGDPNGPHFEGWTLLTAMATLTRQAEVGCLVSCNTYRNPALLANMAKTVDHISNGRLILGLGAGWFERDYTEYNYPFGTAGGRLRAMEESLAIIKHRWQVDIPAPVRNPIPICIGGVGEKVTLRITAEQADIWNGFGPVEHFRQKNDILNQWCERVGRDPAAVERSVLIVADELPRLDEFVACGANHIIVQMSDPWNVEPIERLVAWRNQHR
ncbi:MAG: LLM class F420-dependent oxidoreductase [Chloroflexaceae bacterium]|nr:LLM class F420-dependent oxidoreductase [Chloroflexaceae bacterium]